MLLDLRTLVGDWGLSITGVIHVGAHLAEEAALYDGLGIDKVVWVEANWRVRSKILEAIAPYPGQVLHMGLCLERHRKVDFRITNYDGMSSSVFEWGTHPQFSPDTVIEAIDQFYSTTLDELCKANDLSECNFLNIDTEGAGLLVLEGGVGVLRGIEYVYIEVQTENVYDGAPMLDEYDTWLGEHGGFERVALGMVEGQGWGDAFYRRAT